MFDNKELINAINSSENRTFFSVNKESFERVKNDEKVLIVGLNPSGEEIDRKREQVYHCIQFKTLTNKGKATSLLGQYKLIYPKYFEPIRRFVKESTKSSVKWDWCNLSALEIKNNFEFISKYVEQEYNHKTLLCNKDYDLIIEDYEANKNNQITIYVCDMFNEYNKNEKDLLSKIHPQKGYYTYTLKNHISNIGKTNLKYVYINNAYVSRKLRDENPGENILGMTIEGVKVFFGGMLSGQHAMDVASRERLINQIQKELGI